MSTTAPSVGAVFNLIPKRINRASVGGAHRIHVHFRAHPYLCPLTRW